MEISIVPTEFVPQIWDQVKGYMEEAAEYTYGRYDVDDIYDSITQYEHVLWVAFEGKVIKGAVVTSIKQYPKKRYVDMVFCAGIEGHTWKDPMLTTLQKWAFDAECDGIESSGRLGWSRVFKDSGYKLLWQTYELPAASAGIGE